MKLSMPDEGYTRFREAISTGYIRIYHLKVCSGQRTITFMETHVFVASRRPFIALLDDLITEKNKTNKHKHPAYTYDCHLPFLLALVV